jgi:hypothetical protein
MRDTILPSFEAKSESRHSRMLLAGIQPVRTDKNIQADASKKRQHDSHAE